MFGSTPDLPTHFSASRIYFASLPGLEAGDWNTSYLQSLWPEWERRGDGVKRKEKSKFGAQKVVTIFKATETKSLFVFTLKEQFEIAEQALAVHEY